MRRLAVATTLLAMVLITSAFRVPSQEELSYPVTETAAVCGKAGERIGGSTPGAMYTCCSGLTAMPEWIHNNPSLAALSCQQVLATPSMPGSGNVCSPCGNGQCEPANAENKCSCPADCK
ncbi:MAG: hypothetical protein V4735_02560 [Pseudomonadota bacterium]